MKVLIVITKGVVGGAQTSVLNLAREMKKRGHEVTVGSGDGEWLPVELARENIPFVRFKYLSRSHNPFSWLFFIAELRRYLRGKDFTAVHFNSSNALPGALGAKLANPRLRTIFTFRGMSMLDEHFKMNETVKWLYSFFFRFFLLFVDVPVFVSQDNLEKFGQGKITRRGRLVYNGLDQGKMDFFESEKARRELSLRAGTDFSGKYLIGSVGRLDYQKNYEFLIRAFSKILAIRPDACAVIIGEGGERVFYEGLVKENCLEGKIFFLGEIASASRLLKGFDLFVLPSRYEGLSIALIEALFAGLLILASNVGGNRETVGDSGKEIYPLDSEEEFLAKLKSLQELEFWPELKEKTAERAAQFVLRRTADGYEKIYQEK
jgi:glycosyltransferase involved in cell wall biosynthesis